MYTILVRKKLLLIKKISAKYLRHLVILINHKTIGFAISYRIRVFSI